MKPTLFLDIDGVLNVIPQGRDKYGALFHDNFESNLKRIIDKTGADIVISSTWRMSGLEVMKKMWSDRNLPGDVVGITKTADKIVDTGLTDYYDLVCRGDEIELYIKENGITNYCIIDDDDDFLDHQLDRFVRTSNNYSHPDSVSGYGLTKICSDKVIDILS
jgi:hypothetical protein